MILRTTLKTKFYISKKKLCKKLWKMFSGLPPNQDKRDSHDLIRILGNGKDFQDILQNLDVTQDKSSVSEDF